MSRFYGVDVSDLSRRAINKLFRANDESHLWPVKGRFNVTNRAIRRLQKYQRQGLIINDGLEYAYALDHEITEIVNASF